LLHWIVATIVEHLARWRARSRSSREEGGATAEPDLTRRAGCVVEHVVGE
jgi:hypothetical protein